MRLNTSLLLLLASSVSAIFTPVVKSTSFQGAPDLVYIEDSANIIYLDKGSGSVYLSRNAGESFSSVNLEGVKIKYLVQHPQKKGHLYAISDDLTHFKTVSSGITWKKFTSNERPAVHSVETLDSSHSPIVFHGTESEYALFAGQCTNGNTEESCERQYYYTKDNFESLHGLTNAHSCLFSAATPNSKVTDKNSITCIVNGESASSTALAQSSNFFSSKNYITYGAGLITDVSKLGAGSHSLIAIGAHLSDKNTVNVYLSNDGSSWDKVQFPTGTELSDTFTVVEGTENSFFIDVQYKESSQIGQLFFSTSSNGSFFSRSLEYTHRDSNDHVDYELVQNIDGIVLANSVANGAKILSGEETTLNIQSKISFDQGSSWSNLRVIDDCSGDSCKLHLHSLVQRAINNPDSPGKYFSSPVPGILLGVGNTGSSLSSYEEGDTYISRDAGLTWSRTLNGAHLFEFGDQGSIIVAIEDTADTNTVKFSMNQGSTWQQVGLDSTIRAKLLTTTPDSTNFKFLISGVLANGGYKTFFLNFDKLYENICQDHDFEYWFVKNPSSNDAMCILGHKQKFRRRIRDKNCKVNKEYAEPIAIEDSCPCVQSDYVCSLDFKRNSNGDCVPAIQGLTDTNLQAKYCVDNGVSYISPAPYTLAPGNVCSTSTGLNLAQDIEKKCPNYVPSADNNDNKLIDYDDDDTPDETSPDTNPDEREGDKEGAKDGINDGRVKTSSFAFSGKIVQYVYLDRVKNSKLKDETIVLLTSHNKAYVTHDQGSSWEQIAPDEEFLEIYLNPHNTNHVYLLSTNQKIVYSTDRADNWKYFRTPAPYIPGVQPIRFHPKHSDWLIYIGQLGCGDASLQGSCRTVTYRSKSYGRRFAPMQEHVTHCDFIGHLVEPTHEQLVVCQREENENTIYSGELLFSEDFFVNDINTPLKDVIGFVQADDYLVAATAGPDSSLRAHVSVDGKNWADALFPSNIRVDKQQAYTVLSAQSHAIFLHVTTNPRTGSEFGTILKSNSNGTSYVLSTPYVNRDSAGYVDFEQLENLEGVAVINTVSNPDEATRGSKKQLKTMITHNDGADWDYVQPPSVDSSGKKYECTGKSIKECSLHLHGYTERADYRDTFSSGSAVGLMIGVGNVGDKLVPYLDGHTFLTRDGGVTWKEVKKGVYQWEYGDQGSILVLVNGEDSTNTISYSLDEGDTWTDYKFTEELVTVNDISTVPSDDSRKFLLFTKLPASRGDKSTVYQIDFSQLLKRKCNLDLQHPDTDDFDLWTPKHPHQSDNCLFGHEAKYYRKIAGKDCYIGEKLDKPYENVRDCACTRQDFECDFNYYRDQNGECKLVPGFTPPDHSTVCKELDVDEYWLPTGYRKIPLSTCQGGQQFDKVEAQPCPGREEEFERKHKGITGLALFFVISIPIIGGIALIFVIYNHYVGRYGQIKLGDEEVEFDNSNLMNKASSIVGFGVVTSVKFVSGVFSSVGAGALFIIDFVKAKVFNRSISLDRTDLDSTVYSAVEPQGDESDEQVPGSGDHFEDELLDDGDLTEAELDDRL